MFKNLLNLLKYSEILWFSLKNIIARGKAKHNIIFDHAIQMILHSEKCNITIVLIIIQKLMKWSYFNMKSVYTESIFVNILGSGKTGWNLLQRSGF